MHKLQWLVVLTTFISKVSSFGVTSTHDGDMGFIGYGIKLYEPGCAWPCLFIISSPLNCTDEDLANTAWEKRWEQSSSEEALYKREEAGADAPVYPSGDGWKVTAEATRQCQSRNEYFMKTVAYCLKTRCTGLSRPELETFYLNQFPGTNKSALAPEYQSYSTLIASITVAPTEDLNATKILNYTANIPDDLYIPLYSTMQKYAKTERRHSFYAMVVFVSGAIIPIGMSLLRFLPWPQAWRTKFNAFIIDPPLFGQKHDTAIWGLGCVPTRGQGIFLAYLWAINLASTVQGIDYEYPSPWYTQPSEAIKTYMANRAGVMSCALLPLVMLYAGRNNLLLWLTNWSHSTFLLLHRWTAVLCMLHAVVHSILYLEIALSAPGWDYAEQLAELYWQMGIAATMAMVVLCIASIQLIRRKAYEIFLVLHILLAVLALGGTFYHINLKYTSDYGYENWLIMSLAVWVFDRAIRLARSFRHGVKRAYLTPVDEEYYRLDIPNLSASGHVYLHFPTVSLWRIWENHPFSVASVTYRKSNLHSMVQVQNTKELSNKEIDVINVSASSASVTSASEQSQTEQPGTSGVVVFVRKHAGMTGLLAKRKVQEKGIPVLVEGSYDIGSTFLQDQHPAPTHDYPNLLCIAGGVGITGVLPALDHFKNTARPCGSQKLYWGVRTMPLVHAVESMLGYDCGHGSERKWGDLDVSLSIGQRFNLRDILERELRSQQGGTTVVVCGPTGMADDVRYIVSALARHSSENGPILVKLAIESFTW